MATKSKFWGNEESDISDDDVRSGSESVASTDKVEAPVQAPTIARTWAALDDSSSEDEERRVVKSAKEKHWEYFKQTIKAMNNYKNIDDFGELTASFESLLSHMSKAKSVFEKEAIPGFFIQALAELESYTNAKFADKESLKKLTKSKSTSFNILRSKTRKGLEEYRELIEMYRANPKNYFDDLLSEKESSSDSSDFSEDDMTMSESSEESSSLESEDEEFDNDDELKNIDEGQLKSAKVKQTKEKTDDDISDKGESSDDWGSGKQSKTEKHFVATDTEENNYERGLKLWGKKQEKKKKTTTKEKRKTDSKTRIGKMHTPTVETSTAQTRMKSATPLILPTDKVDAKFISKKLKEVVALRGRKNLDRSEQIKHLQELHNISKSFGPQCQIEVLSHLISTFFDANLGSFTAIGQTQWQQVYDYVMECVKLLRGNLDCFFSLISSEEAPQYRGANLLEDPDKDIAAVVFSSSIATPLMEFADINDPNTIKDIAKLRKNSDFVLTAHVERLDDELTKSFQLADIHSEEYKARLRQIVDVLVLLWEVRIYLKTYKNIKCIKEVDLRILERVYFMNNNIAARMWEIVKKRLSPEDHDILASNSIVGSTIVRILCNECLEDTSNAEANVRTVLYLVYNSSLSGNNQEARNLLMTGNLQDQAAVCSVSTQVLYNRCLVQLGLAFFADGLINEAHNYFSEICNMGRYKELLAQGLSIVPRGVEKSPDQERMEKRRILPYYLHIRGDLVETVSNICGMLLEVPNMAINSFDHSKKMISRNFRKLLDQYERQVFFAPPENPRETIMAATKALQKGDWRKCNEYLMSMTFWDAFTNPDSVKENIKNRLQKEGLRAYILKYSFCYDSFNVDVLANMFELSALDVRCILNKMLIQSQLSGSWDEAGECVIVNHVEKTPLQNMALQLTEKLDASTDQLELFLICRNPKFVITQSTQRGDDRRNRHDDRWVDRRQYGNRDDWTESKTYQRWGDNQGSTDQRQYRPARQHIMAGDRLDLKQKKRLQGYA